MKRWVTRRCVFSAARRLLELAVLTALAPACDAPRSRADERPSWCEADPSGPGIAIRSDIPWDAEVDALEVELLRAGGCVGATAPAAPFRQRSSHPVQRGQAPPGCPGPRLQAFIPLEPGDYDVTVRPLNRDGEAAEGLCGAELTATVATEQPYDLRFAVSCRSEWAALDIIETLNALPTIDHLTYAPSKFVSIGQELTVCVDVRDPDGDPLEVVWEQSGGAPLASGPTPVEPLSAAFCGPETRCATLTHAVEGRVDLRVTVYDLVVSRDGSRWQRWSDYLAEEYLGVDSKDDIEFATYAIFPDDSGAGGAGGSGGGGGIGDAGAAGAGGAGGSASALPGL